MKISLGGFGFLLGNGVVRWDRKKEASTRFFEVFAAQTQMRNMFYIAAKKKFVSLPERWPMTKAEASNMFRSGATLVMPDRRLASNRRTPFSGRKHVVLNMDVTSCMKLHLVAKHPHRSGPRQELKFVFHLEDGEDKFTAGVEEIRFLDPEDPDLEGLIDLVHVAIDAWDDLLQARPDVILKNHANVTGAGDWPVGMVPTQMAQIVHSLRKDPAVLKRIARQAARSNAKAEAEKTEQINRRLCAWSKVPMGTYLVHLTKSRRDGYDCSLGRLVVPLAAGEHLNVEILQPRHKDMIMKLPGVSMHKKLELLARAQEYAEAFPELLEPYRPHPRERARYYDPELPRVVGDIPLHTSYDIPQEEWHGVESVPETTGYAWWMAGASHHKIPEAPFFLEQSVDGQLKTAQCLCDDIHRSAGRIEYQGRARSSAPKNDLVFCKGGDDRLLLVSPRLRGILEEFDLSCVSFCDVVIAGHYEGEPDIEGWCHIEVQEVVSGMRPNARFLHRGEVKHRISSTDWGIEYFKESYSRLKLSDDDLAMRPGSTCLPDIWRARDFRKLTSGNLFFSDRLIKRLNDEGLCLNIPRLRVRLIE